MCKLAGWTNVKNSPLPKGAADRAIMAAHEVIKTTERDGFGVAQYGTSGLRIRAMEPSEFKSLDSIASLHRRAGKAANAFATAFRTDIEGTYRPASGMIIHGRTATCGVSLQNVHPFRRKGWTLAHNGVISWAGAHDTDHEKVTCDSQHLLIEMADNPDMKSRMTGMLDITGYAAFLCFDPKGNMTVAVDDKASLYAGITSKGRWIFGTKPTIVDAIADAWNAKGVTPYPLDNWTWLEFDKDGGEPEVNEWSHGETSYAQARYAQKSLGRTITGYSTQAELYRPAATAGTQYGLPDHMKTRQTDWRWDGYGAPTAATALTADEVDKQLAEEEALAAAEEKIAQQEGMQLWQES